MCDMPQLVNQKVSAARTSWTTEGFSTANFTALPPSRAWRPEHEARHRLVASREVRTKARVFREGAREHEPDAEIARGTLPFFSKISALKNFASTPVGLILSALRNSIAAFDNSPLS